MSMLHALGIDRWSVEDRLALIEQVRQSLPADSVAAARAEIPPRVDGSATGRSPPAREPGALWEEEEQVELFAPPRTGKLIEAIPLPRGERPPAGLLDEEAAPEVFLEVPRTGAVQLPAASIGGARTPSFWFDKDVE